MIPDEATFLLYRKWLGVRGEPRELNHFEVLGLEADEDDAEIIRNAAIRQASYVRTFQRQKQFETLVAQTLERIAVAERTLLDPARRQAYRAELLSRTAAAPAAAAPIPPPPAPGPPPAPSSATSAGSTAPSPVARTGTPAGSPSRPPAPGAVPADAVRAGTNSAPEQEPPRSSPAPSPTPREAKPAPPNATTPWYADSNKVIAPPAAGTTAAKAGAAPVTTSSSAAGTTAKANAADSTATSIPTNGLAAKTAPAPVAPVGAAGTVVDADWAAITRKAGPPIASRLKALPWRMILTVAGAIAAVASVGVLLYQYGARRDLVAALHRASAPGVTRAEAEPALQRAAGYPADADIVKLVASIHLRLDQVDRLLADLETQSTRIHPDPDASSLIELLKSADELATESPKIGELAKTLRQSLGRTRELLEKLQAAKTDAETDRNVGDFATLRRQANAYPEGSRPRRAAQAAADAITAADARRRERERVARAAERANAVANSLPKSPTPSPPPTPTAKRTRPGETAKPTTTVEVQLLRVDATLGRGKIFVKAMVAGKDQGNRYVKKGEKIFGATVLNLKDDPKLAELELPDGQHITLVVEDSARWEITP